MNNKSDFHIRDREVLINRCRELGYNRLKTYVAIKFFYENEKPREVWLWLLETGKSQIEWDSVKQMKWRMKKEIFNIKN